MKKFPLFITAMAIAGSVVSQSQYIDDQMVRSNLTRTQIESFNTGRELFNGGDAIVLDFEGIGNRDLINNFYNGGTSADGFSGTDYGIEITDLRGLIDSDDGGTGNFAHEPSSSTIMYYVDVYRAQMNIQAGFETGIAFYYTSSIKSWIGVYEGLDGTGDLLVSMNLPSTKPGELGGDPGGYYDRWYPISLPFSGIGRSIVFINGTDNSGFDNFTIGTTALQGTQIPISDWALMLGLVLIVLFVTVRFFRLNRV